MMQSLMMTGLTPLCKTDEVVAKIKKECSLSLAMLAADMCRVLEWPDWVCLIQGRGDSMERRLVVDIQHSLFMINSWENRPFTTVWSEPQRHNSKGEQITKTIKKKFKRVRTAYTTEQLKSLEKTFNRSRYIDTESRRELSDMLKISEKSIKIWFQNRRMKEKRDSESSCDSSTESFTNAVSPQINCSEICPKEISTNAVHSEIPDTQYQFPTLNYNAYGSDYQSQCNMPTNVIFDCDRNLYPTQYYPNAGTYYSTEGNQYAHYGSENYWSANTFDMGYF